MVKTRLKHINIVIYLLQTQIRWLLQYPPEVPIAMHCCIHTLAPPIREHTEIAFALIATEEITSKQTNNTKMSFILALFGLRLL